MMRINSINTYNNKNFKSLSLKKTSDKPVDKKPSPAKIVLGLSTLTAAIFGIKKFANLCALRKNFSNIFARKFTLKEALSTAKKYKNLNKITNHSIYENRLREELVRDFGFGNLPIKFVKSKLGSAMIPDIRNNSYIIRISTNTSRERLLNSYVHELRHIKQDELSYRCGREAFFTALEPRSIQNLRRNNSQASNATLSEYFQNKIKSFYDRIWSGCPKINKGTNEYELAQKLNNAQGTYISNSARARALGNKDLYRQNFIEQDAYNTAELMEKSVR